MGKYGIFPLKKAILNPVKYHIINYVRVCLVKAPPGREGILAVIYM